jgi:hypothetical protein
MGTWLPNANLRLGDVGVLEGEAFKQITTLKDLGIPFKLRKGEKKIDYTYTSKSGVRLKTKVAGEVAVGSTLPLADAGVSIQFENEGAFLFHAAGCITDEIGNRLEVGQAMLKLLKAEIWKPNWAVVSTLVHADSATIVVSSTGSAVLDLTAKAPLALANLANLNAGLSVSSQRGDLIRFIAAQGLSPLFGLSRVKQSLVAKLLGEPAEITFGGVGEEEDLSEEEPLELVAL